eukprot:CAMPEP_0119128812 /NCGR_PEP_ID=MMETSP1310-20130426/6814_1 /TAXON_ID=464262 /ORGANISM="Genus nov. species nov., Strain RCC2339" /LENGTH=170 /DNA_ID=CAMNT_0007119185 /DNA_START=144 /DNA_END=653 /DNA_ORIENTATION=-
MALSGSDFCNKFLEMSESENIDSLREKVHEPPPAKRQKKEDYTVPLSSSALGNAIKVTAGEGQAWQSGPGHLSEGSRVDKRVAESDGVMLFGAGPGVGGEDHLLNLSMGTGAWPGTVDSTGGGTSTTRINSLFSTVSQGLFSSAVSVAPESGVPGGVSQMGVLSSGGSGD